MKIGTSSIAACLSAVLLAAGADLCRAQAGGLPDYLKDRGEGIPTSLHGTYIADKQWIIYPFYEYTRNSKHEYSPNEVGVPSTTPGSDKEFFGKEVEQEMLIFIAYAFSDSLALEFESAVWAKTEFTKAPDDNLSPDRLKESGLGDTEMNLRWRYRKETATHAEITFFFKTVFPLQKKKLLIGTKDWEFETGFVRTRGYSFGTLAFRMSAVYDREERKAELSEWAVDYVKRINPKWRGYLSVEGDQLDEISLIGELQYSLGKNAILKLNTGIGLVKKAPDWAPEIGVMWIF